MKIKPLRNNKTILYKRIGLFELIIKNIYTKNKIHQKKTVGINISIL